MASGGSRGEGRPRQDGLEAEALVSIYARRFDDAEVRRRSGVWRELTRYLQRYIPEGAIVLDLACDRGWFINNVRARERLGVDLRDVAASLEPDIRFIQADGLDLLERLGAASVDVVFVSNYLEHLSSSELVLKQLDIIASILRPGGRCVILQPNI